MRTLTAMIIAMIACSRTGTDERPRDDPAAASQAGEHDAGTGQPPIDDTALDTVTAAGGLHFIGGTALRALGSQRMVEVNVKVVNNTAVPIEFQISRYCPVMLRVFRDSSRQNKAVWDRQRSICALGLLRVVLAPHSSRSFASEIPVHSILGDSLPEGRYYFSIVVPLYSERLEISGGSLILAR